MEMEIFRLAVVSTTGVQPNKEHSPLKEIGMDDACVDFDLARV